MSDSGGGGPLRDAVTDLPYSYSLTQAVLAPAIVPLVATYPTTFVWSRKVLCGTVGSALNGAAVVPGCGRRGYRRTTCFLL